MTEDKMNDDALEDVVENIGDDVGCNMDDCGCWKFIRKRILDTLKTIRSKTRKEDAQVLIDEEKSRWTTGKVRSLIELANAILKKDESEQ